MNQTTIDTCSNNCHTHFSFILNIYRWVLEKKVIFLYIFLPSQRRLFHSLLSLSILLEYRDRESDLFPRTVQYLHCLQIQHLYQSPSCLCKYPPNLTCYKYSDRMQADFLAKSYYNQELKPTQVVVDRFFSFQ